MTAVAQRSRSFRKITGPAMAATAVLFVMTTVSGAQTPVPVGPEFQVNSHTTGSQGGYMGMAAGPAGSFVAVWSSGVDDGRGGGIFGRFFGATGAALGSEFRINADAMGGSQATVAGDSNGTFTAVWSDASQDGSLMGVFARRFDVFGVPLDPAPSRVNTYTTGHQKDPSVALDVWDRFVIVWDSAGQDGSEEGIFGQRYDAGGQPLGQEFAVNTYTTGRQSHPSVATNEAGGFVVVWESGPGIRARRYDSSGAGQGPEFPVSSDVFPPGTSHEHPSVAGEPGENFVVVWSVRLPGPSHFEIYARRYDAAAMPLGPEFVVGTYTTGVQWDVSVSADPQGGFTIVWASSGPQTTGADVLGQRYNSNGSPAGGTFRANTYTTAGQAIPSVAATLAGDFVVAWTNLEPQDGDSTGLFAQRFRPDLIFSDGFQP
jgi:hypothetical protein